MIGGIDVKPPEGIERILFKSVFVADLFGSAGINIDRPLREERQHAADIGDHPIDFRKTFQHSAIDQTASLPPCCRRPSRKSVSA